jgi:transposase-like protein
MKADLQNPIFTNPDKAREALEAVRWPDGPICPHCGNHDQDRIAKVEGLKQSHRPGLYYCNECKGQFTVTVGTVFERSKVPLTKWWLATHLLGSSKKGMSAHQLHRMLGVTYKTAWFMAHRIREAMKDMKPAPSGATAKSLRLTKHISAPAKRHAFKAVQGPSLQTRQEAWPGWQACGVALVERGGHVRTFHLNHATADTVREVLVRNVSRKSKLHTDESRLYTETGKEFAGHDRALFSR